MKNLESQGMIIKTPKNFDQINPNHSIMNQQSTQMHRWAKILGIGAASRKVIGKNATAKHNDDDLTKKSI